MPNFPLSHIAVNLSLIVAMAIQPVAFCAAGIGIGAPTKLAGESTCPGCGCCEVQEAGDRCGCCQPESPAESSAREFGPQGCCNAHQVDPKQESARSTKPDTSVAKHATTVIEPFNHDSWLHPVCRCELELPPLSDSTPRRESNEIRNPISLSLIDSEDRHWDWRMPKPRSLQAIKLVVPMHFSQILLCTWRL